MTKRGKWFLLWLAVVLLSLSLLGGLEWHRRQRVASAGVPVPDGSGIAVAADDLKHRYSDPREFTGLCAAVRDRFEAQQRRFLRLQHLRRSRLIQIGRQDQPVAIVELLDRVHFEGRKECRTHLGARQVLGRPFDYRALQGGLNSEAMPPFSNDTPEGVYRYELEGVEELAGRVVLRVLFEPVEPVEGTFKGSVWVDPATGEPVRMRGSAVKLPAFVDRVELLIDYGPAENDRNQMRRATMDVAGGFAFISRRYRIEADLSDYRPFAP